MVPPLKVLLLILPTALPHAAPQSGDDARTILAIRSGDRAAEERLYRKYAPSVLRTATRLLRSTEDARDVLQDTFLAAFERLTELDDPDAVAGWLRTICVRLVYRRFRRRKLLRTIGLDRTDEDAKLELQAAHDAGPDVRAELSLLDRALDALPSEEKIAWTLRYVEGLSLEEIAQTSGRSLATVKRRISAAESAVARFSETSSS